VCKCEPANLFEMFVLEFLKAGFHMIATSATKQCSVIVVIMWKPLPSDGRYRGDR